MITTVLLDLDDTILDFHKAEKEALKLYKKELQCDHQHAIEAYCRDWELSGITKSLPFAQKVNQTGHVLNLKPKRKFDEYM